jgi:hypothetical protein
MLVAVQDQQDSRAVLDTRQFPVVVLSEYGVLPDAERVRVIEELEELLHRPQRHGLMIDLTRSAPIPDAQCIYIADTFKTLQPQMTEKWTGVALLIGKPLLAQTKLATFWQRIVPVPGRVFSELGPALRWLQASEGATPSLPAPVRKAR